MIDPAWPVVCSGYAGTGKTVLALHAILQRSTPSLFLCFNKVLATDIRRITDLSPKFRRIRFDSYDVWDLLSFCERQLAISSPPPKPSDLNAWAELRLNKVLEEDNRAGRALSRQWGCIVVDEAQDLPDWAWSLVDRLNRADTLLFVAESKGQALYRTEPADTLVRMYKDGPGENFIRKRRVFRTTDANFLLSQLFVVAYPSKQEASRVWEKQLGPQYRKALARGQREKNNQAEFELSRSGGKPPTVMNLWSEVQSASGGASPTEVGVQVVADLLRDAYSKVMEHEGKAGDILILVPYTAEHSKARPDRPDWLRIAKKACDIINLQFIDYTDDTRKRDSYSPDEARIATFFSCRGIEGLHTLVLGFEGLAGGAKREKQLIANLGYIVLSRSVFDTDILYYEAENAVVRNSEVDFLNSLLEISGL